MIKCFLFFFFTYNVENDTANHILQFEENPYRSIFFINRLRSDIYIKRTKRLILLKLCKYIRIDVYHFTYE